MNFPCGHAKVPSNTQEISAKYPDGRCKYCRLTARYLREGRDITLRVPPSSTSIRLVDFPPWSVPKPKQTGDRSYALAPRRELAPERKTG